MTQRPSGVCFRQWVGNHPDAEFSALQSRPEIRNQRIEQIVCRLVEVTEVGSPGPMSRHHVYPCRPQGSCHRTPPRVPDSNLKIRGIARQAESAPQRRKPPQGHVALALSVTALGRKTLAAISVAQYRAAAPRSASAG